jgi:hypothetical protein
VQILAKDAFRNAGSLEADGVCASGDSPAVNLAKKLPEQHKISLRCFEKTRAVILAVSDMYMSHAPKPATLRTRVA